jgi:signal transduction histidine kinase
MIEPQLTAKQLTLDVQMPDPADAVPLPVWADRDKLVQVLLNLLSNAVKFTPAARDGRPGRVTVTLSTAPNAAPGRDGLSPTEPHAPVPSPSHVYVQVADTGVGIPSDKLAQVFEPFVQVRTALTREVGGTGLGLAISRDLARGMGGDLWAASTEGEGSTFTLMLRRVVDASGEPVDRRTGDERRVDEERRSGEERRDGL